LTILSWLILSWLMAGKTQQENDNATLLSATLRTLVGLIGERSDLSVENPMAGVLKTDIYAPLQSRQCASGISTACELKRGRQPAKAKSEKTWMTIVGRDFLITAREAP